MGINYYLVNNRDYQINKAIYNNLKLIDHDKMKESLIKIVLNEYKEIFNILDENNLNDVKDTFISSLDETLSEYITNIKYNNEYYLDYQRQNRKHIGKSSYGWLFNFQDQEEWHTYKQFKEYILNKEIMQDKIIIDEDNQVISAKDLISKIDAKQNDPKNLNNPDNFTYSKNVDGYRFSYSDFS